MKWNNIGHEFDTVFDNIAKKKSFFLFGAGDRGIHFARYFGKELSVEGFIDNSKQKQGKTVEGYACLAPDELKLRGDQGIIITLDQFSMGGPMEQLNQMGYEEGRDYFKFDDFLSIYYVYKYNKVYFSTISFLPSTVCNLNCRHCLNFNPFAKQFYQRALEDLKSDVDLFFKWVDFVMVFHLSGGEPFLYKQTPYIIEYIMSKYSNHIGTFRIVTNGTVIPTDDVLEIISKYDIEIKIDDYFKTVLERKRRKPNFKDF